MKFNTRVTVTGIKASKGVLENGNAFDSTKVYVDTDLDDSKGMGKGTATVEYAYGTSERFHELKHNAFPLECEIELEIVTNGKTQKTVINNLKPVAMAKKAA